MGLVNNAIKLRPITVDDTPNIIKWRNSNDVRCNLYSRVELTAEQHMWWLKNKVSTGSCSQFIIVELGNIYTGGGVISKDIGTTFIKNIDRQNNKGEFGIFIGERNSRGKGYGVLATEQMLKHAFTELELNRVYLTVFHDNIPAIKAYEKVGFLIEGTLKQDFLRHDGYCDVIYMGITADMWEKQGVGG